MLRTAEEIINEHDWFKVWTFDDMIRIINQTRKETIEECAERVKMEIIQVGENEYHTGTDVDKQSILNLIQELK